MSIAGNTEADIKMQDEFNEFMISKGAFTRGEDGLIYVNPAYNYGFNSLLLEFKNR